LPSSIARAYGTQRATASALGQRLDRRTCDAKGSLFIGRVGDPERDVRLAVERFVMDRDEEDHDRPFRQRALNASNITKAIIPTSTTIAMIQETVLMTISHV
jgi:hypothetical protein